MENDRSILIRRSILFGVPLLYLVLGLLHPNPDPGLGDETGLFIGLHIGGIDLTTRWPASPRGCNRWQSTANRRTAKPGETGEILCGRLPLVAGRSAW
jgi:hypothetical protein